MERAREFPARTTIPDPSSIEEEGSAPSAEMAGATQIPPSISRQPACLPLQLGQGRVPRRLGRWPFGPPLSKLEGQVKIGHEI